MKYFKNILFILFFQFLFSLSIEENFFNESIVGYYLSAIDIETGQSNVFLFDYTVNLDNETYEKLQIYYWRDDKKYIIQSVGGAIFYKFDFKACNDKFFEVKKILNEQYITPTVTEYINEKDLFR